MVGLRGWGQTHLPSHLEQTNQRLVPGEMIPVPPPPPPVYSQTPILRAPRHPIPHISGGYHHSNGRLDHRTAAPQPPSDRLHAAANMGPSAGPAWQRSVSGRNRECLARAAYTRRTPTCGVGVAAALWAMAAAALGRPCRRGRQALLGLHPRGAEPPLQSPHPSPHVSPPPRYYCNAPPASHTLVS